MPHSFESFPGLNQLEFVPQDELTQARSSGREAMERKFRGDYAVFSAELFTEMNRINALTENGGWAAYMQYGGEGSGDLALEPYSDAVVIVTPGHIDESGRQTITPSIRITTSEQIVVHDGFEFLTYDLAINGYSNALYCYGSHPNRDSVDARKSVVPAFLFDQEGRLGCSDPNLYMPRLAPGRKDRFMRSVIFLPFGHCSDPSTKIAVLEKMKEIFAKLKGSEPCAWMGMAKQKED